MTCQKNQNNARFVVDSVLPTVIRHLLAAGDLAQAAPESLYQVAVRHVVEALLRRCSPFRLEKDPGGDDTAPFQDLLAGQEVEPSNVTAAEVGRIYEYLRSFRLELSNGQRATIVPCTGAKKNQGLFYTPGPIVRKIVSTTLDALEIKDPEEFLDLRILDPAVGTGLFLLEAMDQLTRRVLAARSRGLDHVARRVRGIQDRYEPIFTKQGVGPEHLTELAVRTHVLERCLYGVDLDPTAIAIARAALLEHAFGTLPVPPGIEPKIRVGNSLIGEARGSSVSFSRAEADRRHAAAYFGTVFSDDDAIHAWSEEMGVLHWPDSYPEIFSSHRSGFDAVIGNPPYEIVSVQESGIMERRREQSYFRTMYDTCSGKINTYRLMVERGLSLLRRGGVLGFIVPATLLADSTAARLRERVLEESQVLELVVVPESAQVFDGVTQAVVIVVTRAGGRTEGLRPAFWNGKDCTPLSRGAMVTPGLVKRIGMRIPLIRSEEEKALLQALNQYAPFGGDRDFRPVGSVHQGEINLSVHRRFITSRQTRHPLIRGEHIEPFRVRHPSNSSGRLDWVDEPFFVEHATKGRNSRPGSAHRTSSSHAKPETPWEHERIGLARVVNMATRRRLKAALVPAGYLLGDMTNFIANRTLTQGYLLGLLNSRLLNWRIRLTSTNNYISAAEIEALPVPRIVAPRSMERESRRTTDQVHELLDCASGSLPACLERVHELMRRFGAHGNTSATVEIMESLVEEIMSATGKQEHETEYGQAGQNLLDALVLRLYGVESFIQVLMD